MRNIYFLLRHGKTIYQGKKKKICYPLPEKDKVPLTKEGKKEIKKRAKALKKEKISLIFSSDLLRAKQTAQILAKELNLKVNFDKRLRDLHLGVYHGKEKEKFYQDFPDPKERFFKRPKKGESWQDCQKRVKDFLKDLEKKYQGKKILIVSHGDPLWLLEGILKNWSQKTLLKMREKRFLRPGQLRKIWK